MTDDVKAAAARVLAWRAAVAARPAGPLLRMPHIKPRDVCKAEERLAAEYLAEHPELAESLPPPPGEPPYLETTRVVREVDYKYNSRYGDDRPCQCGHPYHRHFDSYDKMAPVGCKYCSCDVFQPAAPGDAVPPDPPPAG